MAVCCIYPPIIYIWHFSPFYPIPTSLTPSVPPLFPPNRPQCVMLLSLSPCVLIVQHLPMSENMRCFVFCSVSLCWEWWFPDSSMSLQRTWTNPFYGCIVFHGVYVPHFLDLVYRWWAFGLVPSLCYCKQCCNMEAQKNPNSQSNPEQKQQSKRHHITWL